MDRFDCQNGNTATYFARPAERLVLEGYRHWAAGKATGDQRSWENAVDLYLDILGHRGSKTAIFALSEFIGALGRCAGCPLRTFEVGSPHVCRDEIMVMGLIAGIQNHDEKAVENLPLGPDLPVALRRSGAGGGILRTGTARAGQGDAADPAAGHPGHLEAVGRALCRRTPGRDAALKNPGGYFRKLIHVTVSAGDVK